MNPAGPLDRETAQALAELHSLVEAMVSQRKLYEQRAREWILSPAFDKVYENLHMGWIAKTILTLMGRGHVMKMSTAKLREGYSRLGTRGKLIFGCTVIGNTALADQPDSRQPAAVVASPRQDSGALVQASLLATMIGEAHAMGESDTMPQCAKLIADDTYRALRRRPLPTEETGGLPATLYDVRVSMNELQMETEGGMPFIPLLVEPGSDLFAVVPWPVLQGKPMPSAAATPTTSTASVPPPLRNQPPPLPQQQREVSPGGSAILRHQAASRDFEFTMGAAHMEAIEAHIQTHLGTVASVFHELISDRVHLDVHFIAPTPERPFHTLITSGMSERPMTVPEGAEEYQYAELMICLPPNWKLGQEEFNNEANYWPIRWLKKLARLPHDYNTWLGPAHTIPNGDPAHSLADGLPFTGFLIVPPLMTPQAFDQLKLEDGKTINFYGIIPLTTGEMDYKLEQGFSALGQQLAAQQVTELLNPQRPPVV